MQLILMYKLIHKTFLSIFMLHTNYFYLKILTKHIYQITHTFNFCSNFSSFMNLIYIPASNNTTDIIKNTMVFCILFPKNPNTKLDIGLNINEIVEMKEYIFPKDLLEISN